MITGAPVRASHLAGRQAQQHDTCAALEMPTVGPAGGGGEDGWEVSEIMMVDMFGAPRVSSVLSMLGGDLQRAFVVLLESDGQDEQDDEDVDDDEWDYERTAPVSDGAGWEQVSTENTSTPRGCLRFTGNSDRL